MKISIISLGNLSLDTGANVRNYYLHNILNNCFDTIFLRPQSVNNKNPDHQIPLFKRIKHIISGEIPYIEELKKEILSPEDIESIKSADVIQLEEMRSYYFFEKYLNLTKAKIILDTHNIDHVRFLAETDNKGLIEKIMGRLIAPKIQQMEIDAIKTIDYIFVCSEIEKKYYRKHKPANKIFVVPNGVEMYKKKVPVVKKNTMLFMGLLSYPPNTYGLKHYLDKIHPIIKVKYPDVRLTILGPGCPKWLREYEKKDTTLKVEGFVKDVKEYISKAKVCICPIYSGSGTRLKILEYMAMSKAVVSAEKGAEGIKISNNGIFIAKSDDEFANMVMTLFKDTKLCEITGAKAKKIVEKTYDWEKIQKSLLEIYKSL